MVYADKKSNGTSNLSPSGDKENDTPGLDDFGSSSSYTNSPSSDVHCSPPTKESPSRRKKLVGSLRSMSSLRSVRSSPLKEKDKHLAEIPVEPEVSYVNICC